MEALSQGVIQNSNITGVKMFVQEHKISLFAADVLIYFTEPNTSLPKLLLFLETFSSISCYKLDIQKAQIWTFNYKPTQELQSKCKRNWEKG